MTNNAKCIKAKSTSGWLPEVRNKMNEQEAKMYSVNSIRRIAGRKILSRQAKPVSQNQVRQCEHDIQFCDLFSQTPIACFSKSKLSFYDRKDVFYLRTYRGFFMFPPFDLPSGTGSCVFVLGRTAIDFIADLFPILVADNCLLPFLRAEIAAVPVDNGFLSCQQL